MKGKKSNMEKCNQLLKWIRFVNNFKNWATKKRKKKSVFAVSVFLQIINALACHLLQRATSYHFVMFPKAGPRQKKEKTTYRLFVEYAGWRTDASHATVFVVFDFFFTAAALSHAYIQKQLPIPSVKHG